MTYYQGSSNNKTVGLVLLHHDLRIHDNATLVKASTSCDSLLIVYCRQPLFKPTLNRGQPYHTGKLGPPRQLFLEQTLSELDSNLKQLGNRLLCLQSNSHFDKQDNPIFNQVKRIIEHYKVRHVFVSQTHDYNRSQGYQLLSDHLPQVQWHYSVTATLFDRLPVNTLPKSFTPFRKQVEASNPLLQNDHDLLITPTPTHLTPPPLLSDADIELYGYQQANIDSIAIPNLQINTSRKTSANPTNSRFSEFDKDRLLSEKGITLQATALQTAQPSFVGGENQALIHLHNYFDSTSPQHYKQMRNALMVTSSWSHTTRLSPWLANGALSVRMVLNRLRQYEREVAANESTYWIWFELLWREFFYWYAKTHGKKLFRFSGITNKKSRNSFYGERFERWKNGSTPYPIVNACMNQLKATGYMSNRGRQLVASCFIHELGLDWRYGASYFESQLIDYDVASNWGNWQYLAGVGADPRGSRQFNLQQQTQTYDPDGTFIKAWHGDTGDTQIDSIDAADWYI